jgi:hypothetical protein
LRLLEEDAAQVAASSAALGAALGRVVDEAVVT